MTAIQKFKEIRQDGNVIDESMTVEEIFSLGSPRIIIEIRWIYQSKLITVFDAFGMLAKVVCGGEFIVVNGHSESGEDRELLVINADGTRRFKLSNIQMINGKSELGEFRWFEAPRVDAINVFGVVFNRASDNSMFQLDVDAKNGNVIGVYSVR